MNLAAAISLVAQFGHNGAVGTVDISPDGALVLSGSNDNSTRLWDAESGRLLRVHVGHEDQNIVAVRFHPDGRRFWSAAQSGVLREWSTSTGEELRSLTAQGIRSMDMTADGRLIVLAELNSGTSIWDGLTFKLVRRLPAGSSRMMVAAVSDDARMVAVGDQAGAITVYEVATGDVLRTWQAHSSPEVPEGIPGLVKQDPYFQKLDFSADGRLLVSAALQDLDRAARIWDVGTGSLIDTLQQTWMTAQIPPRHVSFSPNGQQVLFGGMDGPSVWSVRQRKWVEQRSGTKTLVMAVAVSGDGRRLVSGDTHLGANLRVWEGPPEGSVYGDQGSMFDRVRFSPDSKRLYTFDRLGGGVVRTWDLSSLQPLRTSPMKAILPTGAMSPDGRIFYSAGVGKILRVDAATGEARPPIQGTPSTIWQLRTSPDGSKILIGTTDGRVHLWDTVTGKGIRQLTGDAKRAKFSSAMSGLDFSPDGRRALGCGTIDGTWRTWNVSTGKPLKTVVAYDVHEHDTILSCVFSPDGKRVLTADRPRRRTSISS